MQRIKDPCVPIKMWHVFLVPPSSTRNLGPQLSHACDGCWKVDLLVSWFWSFGIVRGALGRSWRYVQVEYVDIGNLILCIVSNQHQDHTLAASISVDDLPRLLLRGPNKARHQDIFWNHLHSYIVVCWKVPTTNGCHQRCFALLSQNVVLKSALLVRTVVCLIFACYMWYLMSLAACRFYTPL